MDLGMLKMFISESQIAEIEKGSKIAAQQLADAKMKVDCLPQIGANVIDLQNAVQRQEVNISVLLAKTIKIEESLSALHKYVTNL